MEILGRPAQEYPRAALRGSVAVVMQKAQLFGGTIRSNLLWGNKNAADADLWAALETAQAADFVQGQSPLGWTSLWSRAPEPVRRPEAAPDHCPCAGGQAGDPDPGRQRSALDYATDAALRKALAALPGDLTVFIVSQRAASLQHADQIIVLDDGRWWVWQARRPAEDLPRLRGDLRQPVQERGCAEMSAKAKSKLTPEQRNATLRRVLEKIRLTAFLWCAV